MICTQCGNQQESGKFCGKCGKELTQSVSSQEGNEAIIVGETAATTQNVSKVPVEPNQHVEKVKETSKQYWSYFVTFFKKPSAIIEQASSNLINSLISIGIFILFLSLSLHNNIQSIYSPVDSFVGMFQERSLTPSFFSVFFITLVAMSILLLLVITIVWAITKFFGPDVKFKEMTTIIGTFLNPFIAIAALAFILILLDSLVVGNLLFVLTIIFSIFISPLFIVTKLVASQSKNMDPFYAFIAYIILFVIGLSIVSSIFIDTVIGQYIEMFEDFL